jgi:heme exporter protein A
MTLQGRQLACSRGERHLFTDINFEITGGDALRVAGPNGVGKTSMLRLLCGLSHPAAGQVLWNALDIARSREDYCAELIYLGHAAAIKDDLAAWENLQAGASLAGRSATKQAAWNALDAVGLDEIGHLPTRMLSQGQKKRVALARLWLDEKPRLWILDEPFTALDVQAVELLCRKIDSHLAGGGMAVYTTHQEIALKAGRKLTLDLGGALPC